MFNERLKARCAELTAERDELRKKYEDALDHATDLECELDRYQRAATKTVKAKVAAMRDAKKNESAE